MGVYRIAQICLNGHTITANYDVYPEFRKAFCPDCGQSTIIACKYCNASIQGDYYSPGVIGGFDYSAPSFCHNCGKPYPWTEEKIKAAQELILEDERLSQDDKEVLSQTLPDIIADTPKTQLAATRFKKIVHKAVSFTGEGLKQILIEIASESAKKMLWP